MVRSKICRFNFEADLVLCTDFAHCDVNDVTMPHVLGIEKKDTVYYVISFREGWYGFRKLKCDDPERRITFCKIDIIKTGYIDRYIIINAGIALLQEFSGLFQIIVTLINWKNINFISLHLMFIAFQDLSIYLNPFKCKIIQFFNALCNNKIAKVLYVLEKKLEKCFRGHSRSWPIPIYYYLLYYYHYYFYSKLFWISIKVKLIYFRNHISCRSSTLVLLSFFWYLLHFGTVCYNQLTMKALIVFVND